jgi:hypothetical protein
MQSCFKQVKYSRFYNKKITIELNVRNVTQNLSSVSKIYESYNNV